MNFIFNPNWNITSIEEWLLRFSKSKKNEDGRSAKTLAEFCNTDDAEKIIIDVLNPIVGDIDSIIAFPESHTKIDKYGKGRMHDLAIKCNSKMGEVFVGIEAKVNESFGPSLKSKLNIAKGNSNIKNRIDKLLSCYYNGMLSLEDNPNIPYQLVYSVVSVLEKNVIPIFLILVFNTNKSDEKKVKKNKEKLYEFLKAIQAAKKIDNKSAEYYEATINGQKVYIVYTTINMVN